MVMSIKSPSLKSMSGRKAASGMKVILPKIKQPKMFAAKNKRNERAFNSEMRKLHMK